MFALFVTVLVFSTVFADESRYSAIRFGTSVDDYISFQYDMSPFRESLTVCSWIRRISTSSSHPVVLEYFTSTHEILIGSDGRYNRVVADEGLESLQSKFTHPVGSWFHYCVSWSLASRTIRLYLDGRLIGSDQADSGRTLTMGGTLWFNRAGYRRYQSHVFGGDILQFNIFSDVLSASSIQKIAEGGLCHDLSEFDRIRILSWENIFARSRTGDVREVVICGWRKALDVQLSESEANLAAALERLNKTDDHLRGAEERLQVVASEFNITKTELAAVKVELNATETEFLELRVELNTTKSEILELRVELNTTESEISDLRDELNTTESELGLVKSNLERTKALLQTERARRNKTEERLETCSSSLTDSEKRVEEARTLQNITRWDLLYTAPYFNEVFTEDHLEKLSSSWEVLRK